MLLAAILGYAVRGWRLALFGAVSVFMIGFIGLWLPVERDVRAGVDQRGDRGADRHPRRHLGRAPRPHRVDAISPVLDAFQTIPSVTYIIPFVMIFDVGVVPGIIASVIYAFAAGVRVTALGIKQVPEVTVEAATTFGATDRQLLWGVRIPLALPAIMLAVNQLILMIDRDGDHRRAERRRGARLPARRPFQRQLEIGQGVEVALALTLMAMVLDRLTQALAARSQPPSAPA